MRAQFVASEIGIGLRRNLTMTISVIITVAVSMVFVGASVLVYQQVNLSRGFWYGQIELSIFLCGENSPGASCSAGAVTQEQRDRILADLEGSEEVEDVVYESQAQAYEHFQEYFKDTALAKSGVTPEQLPESYRVKLKDPQRYDIVASQFTGTPGIERLLDYRKVLAPLFGLLNWALRITAVLAVAMLLVASLLIFNTIRLAAFSRRRVTGIMRLVGASSFYIQLPFILEGIIASLVGTAIGFGFLAGFRWLIVGVLSDNVKITPYIGTEALWPAIGVMLLVGVSIAALSSYLTLWRYLRV
jgi:cell division transport system permease protein